MERKADENEIKKALLEKLSKISVNSVGDISVLLAADNDEITVSKNYDLSKFRFTTGQFVQIIFGCSCHPRNKIFLCAGVGKGCPDNTEREELWFLMEGDDGISHFCGAGAQEFNEWEEAGDLILLEPLT